MTSYAATETSLFSSEDGLLIPFLRERCYAPLLKSALLPLFTSSSHSEF